MSAYYFDSSALVKCYVHEVGTAWVRALADPAAANDIYLLRLAEVEPTSAITRRARAGPLSSATASDILSEFRSDLAGEFVPVEVTPSLLSAAAALGEAHALRAYDAVQLAAARQLNNLRGELGLPAMTLISADQELNTAAVFEGLLIEDPNAHS